MSKNKPFPIKRISYRDKSTGRFTKKPERRTKKVERIVFTPVIIDGERKWKQKKKPKPEPGTGKGKGKPEKVYVVAEFIKMAVITRQIDEIVHNLLKSSQAKTLMGIDKKRDMDKILEYLLFFLNGTDKRKPLTYNDAVKIQLLSDGDIKLSVMKGQGLNYKD